MTTKKVTQLTADTTPVGEDLAMIVSNVSVSPASRKIKLLNLLKSIFLADTTQLTFSTVADGEFLKRSGTNLTSGTVAPSDAKYLVQTATSGLSAEQAMGALATGIVKNTTTTGVQSIAAAGSDYVEPGSITTSGLTQNTGKLLGRGTALSGAVEEITIGTGVSLTGTTLSASGTGAPADATYITQTANGGLSAEQAMGSLATGLVKNTTTTGVQSIATATDISSPLYAVDAVGTDAYAITLSPAIAAYTDGLTVAFKAAVANTGGATLAINGLTAKDIVKSAGGLSTVLATNDIRAGQIVIVQFSTAADNFQMQSTLGNAGSAGITTLNTLSGATQTFATGTANNGLNIVSSGTVHTFNLPDADATHSGIVTTGTQRFAGDKAFAGDPAMENDFKWRLGAAGGLLTYWSATNRRMQIANNIVLGWSTTDDSSNAVNDTGIVRDSARVIEINNGTKGQYGSVLLRGSTIAQLPASPVAGMIASVTDGDGGLGWGVTVVNTGAGATKYLVWYNGTNWTVMGK